MVAAPSRRTPNSPNHYSDTLQAWIETTIVLHNPRLRRLRNTIWASEVDL